MEIFRNHKNTTHMAFLCPQIKWSGYIVFGLSVCLSFCLSFCPKTLTLVITFAILKIATWYLACMCISWSFTFWVVKGQGHPSRSKVKYIASKRRRRGHSVSHKHILCFCCFTHILYCVSAYWTRFGNKTQWCPMKHRSTQGSRRQIRPSLIFSSEKMQILYIENI